MQNVEHQRADKQRHRVKHPEKRFYRPCGRGRRGEDLDCAEDVAYEDQCNRCVKRKSYDFEVPVPIFAEYLCHGAAAMKYSQNPNKENAKNELQDERSSQDSEAALDGAGGGFGAEKSGRALGSERDYCTDVEERCGVEQEGPDGGELRVFGCQAREEKV